MRWRSADGAHLADVFHRDRLASAGIVSNREHDERDAFAADAGDQGFERGDVHVAFEGMLQRRLMAFRDDEIDCLGADELDIGPRRVEVRVVGNDITFLARHAEEYALGGTPLMCGDDVTVAENILNGVLEAVEAAAARVTLVPLHDRGPLVRGHGSGAGVGEQVDQDIVGRK